MTYFSMIILIRRLLVALERLFSYTTFISLIQLFDSINNLALRIGQKKHYEITLNLAEELKVLVKEV